MQQHPGRNDTDKVLPFAAHPKDPEVARRTAQSALSVLQQAAETIRTREARAEALVQRAADQLEAADVRIRTLEARVMQAETRAVEAEKWLMRLHQWIQENLDASQSQRVKDLASRIRAA